MRACVCMCALEDTVQSFNSELISYPIESTYCCVRADKGANGYGCMSCHVCDTYGVVVQTFVDDQHNANHLDEYISQIHMHTHSRVFAVHKDVTRIILKCIFKKRRKNEEMKNIQQFHVLKLKCKEREILTLHITYKIEQTFDDDPTLDTLECRLMLDDFRTRLSLSSNGSHYLFRY